MITGSDINGTVQGCVHTNVYGGTFNVNGCGASIGFGSSDCHVYGVTFSYNTNPSGFDCAGGTVGCTRCSYNGCTFLGNTNGGATWLGGSGLTMLDCGFIDCSSIGNGGDGFNVNSTGANIVDGAYLLRCVATNNSGCGVHVLASAVRTQLDKVDISNNGSVAGIYALAPVTTNGIVSYGGNTGAIEIYLSRVRLPWNERFLGSFDPPQRSQGVG